MASQEDIYGKYTEGFIPFTHNGEEFQTYYKLYGTLENRTRNPLIAVHGGPGLIHKYLLPLADLVKSFSIPVIFYDQFGNGRSTHLRDKPPSFFTVEVYVEELDNLIRHFGIQDGYDLLGHSWGGCLASEYVVRRQPTGLKHLVVSHSLASISLWMESTMQLLQDFPSDVMEGIKAGMKDPPRYFEALKVFHAKHGCILKPIPREYIGSLEAVFGPDGDVTVSSSPLMNGWTIIDRLHNIQTPTLVINGRDDIGQDFVCAPYFHKIPKCKWVRFEASSHTSLWEERERSMKILGDFLTTDLE